MEIAALRGKPTFSSGMVTGRSSTEESRWTTAAGNGGSSNVEELRDKYMLISEPTPSPVTVVRGECRVTSRNGAGDEGTTGVVVDSGVVVRSRETRDRLSRGEGVNPMESGRGDKSESEMFNCEIVCECF